MNKIVTALCCLVSISLVNVTWAQDGNQAAETDVSTKATSLRYLQLDSDMNYAAIEKLYTTDATFFDPTGEVFDGDVAQGVVRGAGNIAELQRGWGLSAIRFEPEISFYSGEYALHRGMYHAQFGGADAWVDIPFVTIHRVVGGKVQSRMDFGEYIKSFGMGNRFDETMNETNAIADEYLGAYLDKNFEKQRELMGSAVTFQDPTASVFGPGWGDPISGSESLLSNRRTVFQNLSEFGFETENSFVSNHHKVIMGQVRYTTGDGSKYQQPAVFIIEVRNGKVTRHWDFVDYSVGPI